MGVLFTRETVQGSTILAQMTDAYLVLGPLLSVCVWRGKEGDHRMEGTCLLRSWALVRLGVSCRAKAGSGPRPYKNTDGQTEGETDGQTEGELDGQTEGETEVRRIVLHSFG